MWRLAGERFRVQSFRGKLSSVHQGPRNDSIASRALLPGLKVLEFGACGALGFSFRV